MLDIAPQELVLVAVVALVVIGPKDLPKAMRVVGHWVGRARGVARQFRSGFDTMVREAELEEMEKKWAEENARIMREHPAVTSDASDVAAPDDPQPHQDESAQPVTVEKPTVVAAPAPARPPEGAAS
ncbi:MAG TPA: Sec-independent protein translocase protein TatB [Sphingomonas sp.]|jgi:sec-independent protein translocase protein TatB|nr:Sec-independent protein translocase protein TatB [Sphingomonas sp.]